MTTLAYCSVSADGRTFPHHIWMREEAFAGLSRFTEAMHAEGARVAIQVGHAGWFASPHVIGAAPIRRAHDPDAVFEETFFLPQARRFRAAVGLPLMLLGGVIRRVTMRARSPRDSISSHSAAR